MSEPRACPGAFVARAGAAKRTSCVGRRPRLAWSCAGADLPWHGWAASRTLRTGAAMGDSAALRREIERRAAALARMGVGRGAVVAIAHGGTARFFADLIATWLVGAAAACLDPSAHKFPSATPSFGFLRPAVLLVDDAVLLRPTTPLPARDVAEAQSLPAADDAGSIANGEPRRSGAGAVVHLGHHRGRRKAWC